MKKQTLYIKAALLSIAIYLSSPVLAQDFGDIDFDDNVQDVPFDGGVSLLIAAALVYGAKKAYTQYRLKTGL